MNRKLFFYLVGLYALVIGFGFYLNIASGDEGIQHIDYPRPIEPALSCQQYLNLCEKSCTHRGGMFRFLCLGKDYNPDLDRYRCQCGDDALTMKTPTLQDMVKKEVSTQLTEKKQAPSK